MIPGRGGQEITAHIICLSCAAWYQGSYQGSDDLKATLKQHVAKEIGPIAKPGEIQFTDALPKTRSGKIMRRILRKVAANQPDDLGDVSTLAEPTIVEEIVQNHAQMKN